MKSSSKQKERKIMFCDNKGCESACCFGCKCCESRGLKIQELEARIERRNQTIQEKDVKIMQLMAKNRTVFGSINVDDDTVQFLKSENERLRTERDSWKKQTESKQELERQIEEKDLKIKELEELVEEYDETIKTIKKSVEETEAYLINDNKHKEIFESKIENMIDKYKL